jgi:cation:H+ antiporter
MAVLVKAADLFTTAAERVGLHFGMPPFVVGVTIVALGTSLPELVSSVIAVTVGSPEIVSGNVVGSNIANILLVLGVAAIVGSELRITHELAHVDMPMLIGSTLLMAVMAWDGVFTMPEGILCLAALLVYLLYTLAFARSGEDVEIEREMRDLLGKKDRRLSPWTWVMLVASAGGLYVGARYTVVGVLRVSEILNVGAETVAVTAVALGTSLPELVVSVAAASKGKTEISVGNILGSNIFNCLAVMGVSALFGRLVVPDSIISFGLPMMLVATLLYFFVTLSRRISHWEGWLLVIFYLFFVGRTLSWL